MTRVIEIRDPESGKSAEWRINHTHLKIHLSDPPREDSERFLLRKAK
jgi:hypothetical protein